MSRITRDLLRHIFLEDEASTKGFLLLLIPGQPPIAVKINLAAILGDEEALNAIYYSKGASGIMPCLICSVTGKPCATDRDNNLLSMTDRDPNIPDISCTDIARCDVRSDADIWRFCDELELCPKGRLKEKEHTTGLKLNLNTLLFCKPLREFLKPSTTTAYDPLHILFSNGIVGSEIMLCLGEVKRHVEADFPDVRRFIDDKGFHPKCGVFSEAREKASTHTLKAGATELMCAYLLFRVFLIEVYGPSATEPFIMSILLLFEICDEIRALLKCPTKAEVRAHEREVHLIGLPAKCVSHVCEWCDYAFPTRTRWKKHVVLCQRGTSRTGFRKQISDVLQWLGRGAYRCTFCSAEFHPEPDNVTRTGLPEARNHVASVHGMKHMRKAKMQWHGDPKNLDKEDLYKDKSVFWSQKVKDIERARSMAAQETKLFSIQHQVNENIAEAAKSHEAMMEALGYQVTRNDVSIMILDP